MREMLPLLTLWVTPPGSLMSPPDPAGPPPDLRRIPSSAILRRIPLAAALHPKTANIGNAIVQFKT